MKKTILKMGMLAVGLVWAGTVQQVSAGEVFPAAPTDQVSVRTLPAFTVVQTDTTATIDKAWTKGFRAGAVYGATVHSGLNTPTIITFPDWEKNPTADGEVHVQVQCILDPIPGLPRIHEHGATLEPMPRLTVACYALTGAYTPANFVLCLNKIEAYLKSKGIPAVGPPRYLYYTDTTWMPSFWRVGEVQVPIAPGSVN